MDPQHWIFGVLFYQNENIFYVCRILCKLLSFSQFLLRIKSKLNKETSLKENSAAFRLFWTNPVKLIKFYLATFELRGHNFGELATLHLLQEALVAVVGPVRPAHQS
jgi:hypothetical protein